MIVNFARLRSNEVRYGLLIKWLLLAAGIWLMMQPSDPRMRWVVGMYAALNLLATLYFVAPLSEKATSTLPYWLSQGVDVLFVSALIALGEGIASPLYLIYPVLALRTLVYGPDARWLIWLPFTFGPVYILALFVAYDGLGFLADPLFLTRYGLLLVLIFGTVGASLVLAGRLAEVDRLRLALAAHSEDLAAQARTLQRTATDLGDRVLELRALQEVARALSATLYLNDTLKTVADRLSRLVETPYCAVALLDDAGETLTTLVAPTKVAPPLVMPLAVDEVSGLHAALAAGRTQALPLAVQTWPVSGLEMTPMMVRGQPIGALLVGTTDGNRLTPIHRSLTESFAYLAATAVENARLYSDSADKRRELEAVLAGIGDGVLVVDTEGKLLLINPVATRALGLTDPVLGLPVDSALAADELITLLSETAAAGRFLMRELPLMTAGTASDGQPRTFQALAAPIYRTTELGEQVGGVVVVLRDITAQKELERMKSNFLSVISHELKTPLHSIKGFVDIILMGKTGPVTELQRDFLGTVQEQTGHLQRLIEDLLEFSRLESGQIKLRPVPLSPNELVTLVVEKLEPLAERKNLHLTAVLPAALPDFEVDPMRMEQVLTNLVENALKFTPDGGAVQVRGWMRGEMIELAVVDTGIGVPVEERERIFERFYQVDSSARRRYKGTGLGLTICKHIVTQHGGRIWVEGGTEGGSAFHITVPLVFPELDENDMALNFGRLAAEPTRN
ncbi:MAG: ATP-binding protein [Anaerolineae bacterium]